MWNSIFPVDQRTCNADDIEHIPLCWCIQPSSPSPFPKNITLGVPRLKEIINAVTNIKMPSLSVYLEPDIAEDKMMVNNVQQELAFMSLHTVTAAVEIWYDPDLTTPPPLPPDTYHYQGRLSLWNCSLLFQMKRTSRSCICSRHDFFSLSSTMHR